MRYTFFALILSIFLFSCSDDSSNPKPDPIISPDIEITDVEATSDAFLESNPGWTKTDGMLPASLDLVNLHHAYYDTVPCFNGRRAVLGFNDYEQDMPSGYYLKLKNSDSYFTIQNETNLRKSAKQNNPQKFIPGTFALEDKSQEERLDVIDMFFLMANIPPQLKPGLLEFEYKAFYDDGRVSQSFYGKIRVYQLGSGELPSGGLLKRRWNFQKILSHFPPFPMQEIICGSEQTGTFYVNVYCQDGTYQTISYESVYTYIGTIDLRSDGSYKESINARSTHPDLFGLNCNEPFTLVESTFVESIDADWGIYGENKLITISTPSFSEEGYFNQGYLNAVTIKNLGFNSLSLEIFNDPSSGSYYRQILGI